MTIRLEALIERWPGESILYITQLPGFVVHGADSATLQRAVSDALKGHLAWLVHHDLIEDPAGEIDLAVVEQAKAVSASAGPRFAADLPVPSNQEIENALAVGRAALSDVIDAFDLPDSPLTSTMLRLAAERDDWYAERLGTTIPARSPADPIDRLVEAAGTFEEAVDAFIASDRPDLWEMTGEEWTLAKLLRRRTADLRDLLPDLPMSTLGDDELTTEFEADFADDSDG